MKKQVWLMLLAAVATLGWSQDKPKTEEKKAEPLPTISAEDRANYLEADREFIKSVAALQATPQYQAAQAAQSKRQQTIGAVYQKYKVGQDKALCDGPGAPPCEGVAVGELVFREAPKPEAKREEPKK